MTYVCGYILVLLFVPLVAPRLMGVNLKEEAAKLEAELSVGGTAKPGNLLYRKFQARAYRIAAAAGSTVCELEARIGRRAVVERILRDGEDIDVRSNEKLQLNDEILLAGPTAAIVAAAQMVGPEIEGEHVMRSVPGEAVEVFVTARDLHGRTLSDIVDRMGDAARGVFLRALTRRGQEVPIMPQTRIYVGDVMTLVGHVRDLDRVILRVGQPLRTGDRTDIAFLAIGLAIGLLVGLLSVTVGSVPLTLGGGGGASVAGLVCGWLRSRRPTMGASPARGPAIPGRSGSRGICRGHRPSERTRRSGRDPGQRSDAAVRRRGGDAHAHGHRHAGRAPVAGNEPGHRVRRTRGGDDRGRGRNRVLRGCRESNAGPRRGRALRDCQRLLDGAWAYHRQPHFRRLEHRAISRNWDSPNRRTVIYRARRWIMGRSYSLDLRRRVVARVARASRGGERPRLWRSARRSRSSWWRAIAARARLRRSGRAVHRALASSSRIQRS